MTGAEPSFVDELLFPTVRPLAIRSTQPSHPSMRQLDDCYQLRMLVARQHDLQFAIEKEVRALIARGESWTDIGRVLGLSRQGARQRYTRKDTQPTEPAG